MKSILLLAVACLFSGCATPEQKQKNALVIGEYEYERKNKDEYTLKYVLFNNGVFLILYRLGEMAV